MDFYKPDSDGVIRFLPLQPKSSWQHRVYYLTEEQIMKEKQEKRLKKLKRIIEDGEE